jgi:hypothetical protein
MRNRSHITGPRRKDIELADVGAKRLLVAKGWQEHGDERGGP